MRCSVDEQVEQFRRFRDEFYEKHPSASVEERKRALKERAAVLLQDVPIATADPGAKVRNCLLRGKILNVLTDYDSKCEEHLTRAVKLDPTLVEAWNELGECMWKKNDIQGATNCFNTALQKRRNPVSLRCLSAAKRQESCSAEEKREKIAESLKLAKEAVELDKDDATSWYCLGNANLTYFFACGQTNAALIKEALDAYQQALSSPSESRNADLYFNQAQALNYEQSYQATIEALRHSVALDPSFNEPKEMLDSTIRYLHKMHECVLRKGKLKAKKLDEFVGSFDPSSQLGIYALGEYKTKRGKNVKIARKMISELQSGPNPFGVVLGRVVGMVVNEQTIPYTFGVIDACGFCSIMAVYNFSPAFGVTIGQFVACVEPYVVDVAVHLEPKDVNFRCIRVASPENLVINGRKLGHEHVAYLDAKVTMLNS